MNVPCRGKLSTFGVAKAPTWKRILQSRGMLVIWIEVGRIQGRTLRCLLPMLFMARR